MGLLLELLPKASAATGGKSGDEAKYAVANRRSLPKAPWNQIKQARADFRKPREAVVASMAPSVVLDFVFELNGTKASAHLLRSKRAGVQFGQATANYSLSHVQVIHCQNALTAYGHSSQYYGTYFANFYFGNALLNDVGKSFTGSYYNGTVEHLTVDGCTSLAEASPTSPYSTMVVKNSIIANTMSQGSGVYSFSGSAYNGFYNSPVFGTSQFVPPGDPPAFPFQTVGAGKYFPISVKSSRCNHEDFFLTVVRSCAFPVHIPLAGRASTG